MAVSEQPMMSETKGGEHTTTTSSSTPLRVGAITIPPLLPVSTNQTPVMPPSAKPPLFSSKVTKAATTPDAFHTPATIAMTPYDAHSLGSLPKQLCIPEQNQDSSSTEAASSKSSNESEVLRLGRDPSPQPEGRNLFSLDYDEDLDYSEEEFETTGTPNISPNRVQRTFSYTDGVYPQQRSFYLRSNSAGSPLVQQKDPFGCKYEETSTNNNRMRKLRSRRSSARVESSPAVVSFDYTAVRRVYQKTRSVGDEYPLSVVNVLEDDQAYLSLDEDGCEEEQERDGSQSPFRLKRRRRRSSDISWLKPPHRLATTKHMVWLLCLVGLTSVTMIVTTNHRMSQAEMERRDHAAVFFRHDAHDQRSKAERPQTPSNLLRGAQEQHKKNRRTVNLNTIAQFREVETIEQATHNEAAVVQHPPVRQPQAKPHHHREGDHRDAEKPHPHHHSDDHHNDLSQDQSPAEHHHHHHRHHDETIRVYAKATPGIIGISAIPRVSLPTELDDVASEASFESIDGGLYSPGLVAADESGGRRIVALDDSSFEVSVPPPRLLEEYPTDFTDNTQLYSVLDSGDERISTMEMRAPYVQGECVPMQEWQTTFNPSCNGMHELDMTGMGDNRNEDDFKLFGMNGFWRNAWRYDSTGGHSALSERDTVVLKTLRINHRFEDAYFENSRIDAVVLERLTASPHVINVFGFCGHSVITEYADGKRLGELADKMKRVPLARLQIARDIANGLADVHGIDGDDNATFVHFDINPANVVSIGGTLKLNDFNIGVLRRWNTTSNSPCGIPAQYPNPQWRSPEEARREVNLTEKVDVFSLGHIFFRLICGHEPWHKLEPDGMPSKDVLNEKVRQGILPTIPDEVMNSTDAEVTAILHAMMRCYTYDPVSRPSAREIATSLQDALNKLEHVADVK